MSKNTKRFFCYAIILIIIKQCLVSGLPIYAIGNAKYDDQLMVMLQTKMFDLKWLGSFNSLTFMKGMFFPLFLTIISKIGLSYISTVTLIYSFACLLFIYSIKNRFNNKSILYIIFLVLLFNPITFDYQVIQRVYRNSLIPSEVLLIISSMFYIFNNRFDYKNKKLFIFSLIGGLSLAAFSNTIEDIMWLLIGVLLLTLIMLIEHLIINKKSSSFKKICVFILPLCILGIINMTIESINYKKYGTKIRNIASLKSYKDATAAIYSVPTEKNIKYTSVTREKLARMYPVSPALKSIRDSLDKQINTLDVYGRIQDNEIEDGWFYIALRLAAEENGFYKNADIADKFYRKIAADIKSAQNLGRLEKKKTIPHSLMSPWKKGYYKKLNKNFRKIYIYTNSYKDVMAKDELGKGSYEQIKLFEAVTNDLAIMPNISSKFSGWYIYNPNNYTIDIKDKDKVLKSIECKKKEICNIDLDFNEFNIQNLKNINLVITSKKKEVEVLHSKNKLSDYSDKNKSYHFNSYSLENPTNYQKKITSYYVNRINKLLPLYKKSGIVLNIISIVIYISFFIISLIKNRKVFGNFVLLSMLVISYLLLCYKTAYIDLTSVSAINTLYLAGAYCIILMFNMYAIGLLIDYLIKVMPKLYYKLKKHA